MRGGRTQEAGRGMFKTGGGAPVQMWNRPGFVCKSQSMPASVSFHKQGHYPAHIVPGDPQIMDTSIWKVYEMVNKQAPVCSPGYHPHSYSPGPAIMHLHAWPKTFFSLLTT